MKQTNKKFLLLAMIATLIAVGLHLYLTQHYYGIKFGTATGESFCNINDVLNCDAVTASKFSAIFGIPLAMLGLFANLILLYFITVTRQNLTQDSEKTSRYTFAIAAFIALTSVVMGIISVTAMSNLCIFCIATYILSFITLFATWKGSEKLTTQNLIEDLKDVFVTDRWVAGFVIAIPVFAFVANLMYLESTGLGDVQKAMKERIAYWQASVTQNFDLTQGLTLQMSPDTPAIMTIVEFADFRCGHCKTAADPLHAFTKSHPDVKLVFKPFPLDGTCNTSMQGGGDGISCGLAFATMCAEQISQKGWAVHDYIFANQEEITGVHNLDKNLEAIAKANDLSLDQLKACVKDPKAQDIVRKMADEGAAAQIRGTPTIFVNGKLLQSGQVIPVLEAAYQSLK